MQMAQHVAMGAGEASGLTDAQMTAADVNTDLFNQMLIKSDLANLQLL